MLQRSLHEQPLQEPATEAPGHATQAIGALSSAASTANRKLTPAPGYRGVYNATPPPQQVSQNPLGGARAGPPQPILPVDLPPQAFLTSSMLLDMVDSRHLRVCYIDAS